MQAITIFSLMLLITSMVGIATWAALASVTYNWATDHTGVKRDVVLPADTMVTLPVVTTMINPVTSEADG